MITCDQHDYIEIACTFRYPIKVTMKSGDVIECVALDTQRNENKDECIKVNIEGVESLIVLDGISTMKACVDNPHFDLVSFTQKK